MKNNTNQIMKLNIPIWIKYWLSKHKNASYILSEILTGTEFFLEDSAPKKFKKFIPIGRTTQESTTGKQLLEKLINTPKSNGAKYSTDRLSVEVDFANSSDEYFTICNVESPTTKAYTLAFKASGVKNGETPKYNVDGRTSSIKTLVNGLNVVNIPSGITIPNNHLLFDDQQKTSYPNTSTVTFTDFMLVEGTYTEETMPDYEPYTGGEPAPNPIYPYAIKNTGDNVNIFDLKSFLTDRGVTYTENDDGSLTFTITQALYSNPLQFSEEDITVSLSGIVANGTATGARIFLVNKAGTNVGQLTTSVSSIQNISACKIRFDWSNSGTVTMKNIKLEQGTQATPYSPYGCGNVNEKISNKNLWINEIENGETSNGITVTKNEDGSLTFNGTASALTEFYFVKSNATGKYLEANQTYTISGVKNSNTALSSACTIGGVGNFSTSDVRTLILSTTREITKDNSFIRFAQGTVLNNYTIKPMIEQSSTATSYVSHSEQNISFPLSSGQKFYEGSHPDDDEKVHHKMGEIILDGTVGGYNADYNWFYLSFTNLQIQKPKTLNILSNYFKYYNRNEFASDTTLNGISFNTADISTASTFVIRNTNCTNANEYKTWLAEVLPIVQYELEEEQTEDFTEEQKTAWEQIKKARTYKNITHISSEDETPANLRIQYYKEG